MCNCIPIKQADFIRNTKTKSFSTPPQTNNSDPRTKEQANFDPHTTNTSVISTQRLKPGNFGPPHQNRVNSNLYAEIKSSSIPEKKSTQYRSSRLNQVDYDAHNT